MRAFIFDRFMSALSPSLLLRRGVVVARRCSSPPRLALVVLVGVPYQRDLLAIWLLLGLLCFSLSDLRGYARGRGARVAAVHRRC